MCVIVSVYIAITSSYFHQVFFVLLFMYMDSVQLEEFLIMSLCVIFVRQSVYATLVHTGSYAHAKLFVHSSVCTWLMTIFGQKFTLKGYV